MRWFNCLMLVFLCSCTTLTSKHQIIAVTTQPTDAKIYAHKENDKPELIATSPAFVKIKRESNKTLYLQPNGEKLATSFNMDCKYRWAPVLLGNLVFYIFWPIGVLVDTVQGSAYECPPQNNVELKTSVTNVVETQEGCRNYFVLFPSGLTTSGLTNLYIEWKKNKHECDTTLSFEELVDARNRYNLYSDANELGDAMRRRIYELGYEKKITHLVFVNRKTETTNEITYNVRDVFTEEIVESLNSAENNPHSEAAFHLKAVNFGIDLLPNSISFAFVDTESNLELKSNLGSRGQKTRTNSAWSWVTNWGLRNVDHPKGFDSWDYQIKFSPDATFRYTKQEQDYVNLQDETKVLSYDYEQYSVIGTANGDFILHTPGGALNFGVGIGPGYDYLSDDVKTRHFLNLYAKFSAGYTVFVNDNWFIRLSSTSFQALNHPMHVTPGHLDGLTSSGLEIGYYFPTFGTSLQRLLQ